MQMQRFRLPISDESMEDALLHPLLVTSLRALLLSWAAGYRARRGVTNVLAGPDPYSYAGCDAMSASQPVAPDVVAEARRDDGSVGSPRDVPLSARPLPQREGYDPP